MPNSHILTRFPPLPRRGFLGLAAAAGIAGTASCSTDKSDTPPGGTATSYHDLTLWNGTFATYQNSTNTQKNKNDFWLTKELSKYQTDHNVTVSVNNSARGPDLLTKIRTAGVAHKGPDLGTVWGAGYLMAVKDFFTPLEDYYPPDKREGIKGWFAMTDGFVEGKGHLYAVPAGTDPLTCFYYNTKLLDKAHTSVDPDVVPTWDQFMSTLDKIKSSGVTPLAMSSGSYLFQTLMYWIVQNIGGNDGVIDLKSGKRQFASPEVKQAVQGWLSLVPYTHPGAPVLKPDDVLKLILTDKAAIAPYLNLSDLRDGLGQNVSLTKLPNIRPDAPVVDSGIGGPGQAFAIPAAAKNVQAAVTLINFLNSPDVQLARAKMGENPLPNVPDLADSDVYTDPLWQKLAEWSVDFIYWPDNILDARLISYLQQQTQLVWNGDISTDQFLESLDKKHEDLAARS